MKWDVPAESYAPLSTIYKIGSNFGAYVYFVVSKVLGCFGEIWVYIIVWSGGIQYFASDVIWNRFFSSYMYTFFAGP